MRVYTKLVFELNDTGMDLVSSSYYEYHGPVEECKKGREQQEQLIRQNMAQQQAEYARRGQQLGIADPTLRSWESMDANQLSPAAAAQLAADRDNISRTYRQNREAVYRSLADRGLTAPSGLGQVQLNAVERGEDDALTDSYRNALGETQRLKEAALNARLGLASDAGGQAVNSGNLASTAAARRAEMGSGIGDVVGGIANVASAFVPGGSVLGSVFRRKPKIGQLPLTYGSYGSGSTYGSLS